jgi:hypothetical protein
MALDEVIAALEAEDPERVLPFGFTNPHSYRGYYDELAFEPAANVTIGSMLAAARSALGATYEGWKGGEYTMQGYTDCWLVEQGTSECDKLWPAMLTLMLASNQLDGATQDRLRTHLPRCHHWQNDDDGKGVYCTKERKHEGDHDFPQAT